MKKLTKQTAVVILACMLCGLLSSCASYEVRNVRSFCPSSKYGLGDSDDNEIYISRQDRRSTAVANGVLYMTIDDGWQSSEDGTPFEVPADSFYLMRCGEEEWEKLAEAPLAKKYRDTYIPIVVNDEDRIFAVTNVEEGICVYEYENGELVPNTFEEPGCKDRMWHLMLNAGVQNNEGEEGTIYICYCIDTELHLLTYDIAQKEFTDSVLSGGYGEDKTLQPYIFFPDENTVEIYYAWGPQIDLFRIDTGSGSMEFTKKEIDFHGLMPESYGYYMDHLGRFDLVRLDSGDVHIVLWVYQALDDGTRSSLMHIMLRDGEVVRSEVFMPNSYNYLQLFEGVDGKAYMLLLQNDEDLLPDFLGGDLTTGSADGFLNAVMYRLEEGGIEELGSIYIEGVPYIHNGAQLTADENKRIIYVSYKGNYTDNIITFEVLY